MLKILYSAGPNSNSKIQLSRFLDVIDGDAYSIKIAAFKKSSPKNVEVNWTLDCLLDIFNPDLPHSDNNNFSIYYDQVKSFAPDLIISDLEHFTSHIANLLNIPLWQYSSSLINSALSQDQKYGVSLFSRYAYSMQKHSTYNQWQRNIINNSDRNFVCSHFGDTPTPPLLNAGFEWIRPYYQTGKKSTPCQHNIVAAISGGNKRAINLLQKHSDCVAFTEFPFEKYNNLFLKDISNQEEYFCNLANSNLFICEGQTSFLADAFYNKKYSAVLANMDDLECIINSVYSEHFGLSTTIYEDVDISSLMNKSFASSNDSRIGFLHEKLGEV